MQGRNFFLPFAATSPYHIKLAPSRVSRSRVIFCHRANITFVNLRKMGLECHRGSFVPVTLSKQ